MVVLAHWCAISVLSSCAGQFPLIYSVSVLPFSLGQDERSRSDGSLHECFESASLAFSICRCQMCLFLPVAVLQWLRIEMNIFFVYDITVLSSAANPILFPKFSSDIPTITHGSQSLRALSSFLSPCYWSVRLVREARIGDCSTVVELFRVEASRPMVFQRALC